MPAPHPSAVPFEQLAALVAFVRQGSVAAAARQLGISQPAVSNLLARLDGKFSQPLFATDGSRKVLTSHGHALFQSIDRPVAEMCGAYDRFQRLYATPERHQIRLAARREILQRVLTKVSFSGNIAYLIMTGDEIVDALKHRECDLAIVQRDVVDEEFAVLPLFSVDVVLAVPAALAKGRTRAEEFLTTEFFAATPFVAYRDVHPFLAELESKLNQTLVPQRIARICTDWDFVAQLVGDGAGFTVMPAEFRDRLPKCKIVSLSPQLLAPVAFKAVCLKSLLHVPAIDAFVKRLRREL